MLLQDEVRRIGIVALAIAALLVILALLLAPSASNQVTPAAVTPFPQPHTRMVRTERFIDYPTPTAQERAAGIVLLRQAFAEEAAAPGRVGGLPVWWTAETRYLPPLPPERTGEAPSAAAAPQRVSQTETGRQDLGNPERAACSRNGLRTVWSGQYRWRCRR